MSNFLCVVIVKIIHLLSQWVEWQYRTYYMQAYHKLSLDYHKLSLEVEAILETCREVENQVKQAQQREKVNAEKLIILQATRKHLPQTGLVAIAHLMLSEVDVALLALNEATIQLIAQAAGNVAQKWAFETLTVG